MKKIIFVLMIIGMILSSVRTEAQIINKAFSEFSQKESYANMIDHLVYTGVKNFRDCCNEKKFYDELIPCLQELNLVLDSIKIVLNIYQGFNEKTEYSKNEGNIEESIAIYGGVSAAFTTQEAKSFYVLTKEAQNSIKVIMESNEAGGNITEKIDIFSNKYEALINYWNSHVNN